MFSGSSIGVQWLNTQDQKGLCSTVFSRTNNTVQDTVFSFKPADLPVSSHHVSLVLIG